MSSLVPNPPVCLCATALLKTAKIANSPVPSLVFLPSGGVYRVAFPAGAPGTFSENLKQEKEGMFPPLVTEGEKGETRVVN